MLSTHNIYILQADETKFKSLVVVVADELQAEDLLAVPVLGLGLGAVRRGPRAGAARQQETQTVLRLLQVGISSDAPFLPPVE